MSKSLRISNSDKTAGDYALEVDEKTMIPLQEIRCPGCGRFLGYQAIVWGVIKIKCDNSKCKKWLTIDISP
jgi:phage FluMu protein Com